MYKKETDPLSYLKFSNGHPNHTFSGTVYSQSLRLKRIVYSKERLEYGLLDLAEAFKKAEYTEKKVKNIITKVPNLEREERKE